MKYWILVSCSKSELLAWCDAKQTYQTFQNWGNETLSLRQIHLPQGGALKGGGEGVRGNGDVEIALEQARSDTSSDFKTDKLDPRYGCEGLQPVTFCSILVQLGWG